LRPARLRANIIFTTCHIRWKAKIIRSSPIWRQITSRRKPGLSAMFLILVIVQNPSRPPCPRPNWLPLKTWMISAGFFRWKLLPPLRKQLRLLKPLKMSLFWFSPKTGNIRCVCLIISRCAGWRPVLRRNLRPLSLVGSIWFSSLVFLLTARA